MFNSRPRFAGAMRKLLSNVRADVLIVSFNNEGYLSREEMETMLAGLWGGGAEVATIEHDFKRYVGAQIGIYNPSGEKVGRVSHLRNKEYLYVAAAPGRLSAARRVSGLSARTRAVPAS